jgi:hypothetical protein
MDCQAAGLFNFRNMGTFPAAPIVFCGIDRREVEKRDPGPNATGVLVKREFKPTLDLALRLHPDTRQVYFIAGTSGFNRYWLEQARREMRESEARIKITYLPDLPMEKLETEVAACRPNRSSSTRIIQRRRWEVFQSL